MQSCQHPKRGHLSQSDSLSICAGFSILFVASLYFLVPRHVQRLGRDDPTQIRWRCFATTIVSAVCLLLSKLLSCEDSFVPSLGISLSVIVHELLSTLVTVGHVLVLYLNPMVLSMMLARGIANRNAAHEGGMLSFLKSYYAICIGPTVAALLRTDGNEQFQWVSLRNYIMGPITEELVFRCSIITVLQTTGMSDISIIWISPMFFGFAHAHHAFLRYVQGLSLVMVLLQTIFQFAYTTIFGMYASYVYLRTKSVLAVCVCHAFCNVMGLPDLNFFRPSSPYYSSRYVLSVLLFTGIVGFILGIFLDVLPAFESLA
jgi:prenyl protein peptidase